MADTNSNSSATKKDPGSNLEERGLEKMEALLRQSANGFHLLFNNRDIARALSQGDQEPEYFDFDKMKKVQDVMTGLVAKQTYYEKMAYLQDLDDSSLQMLIRTYFHIVENTVRAQNSMKH